MWGPTVSPSTLLGWLGWNALPIKLVPWNPSREFPGWNCAPTWHSMLLHDTDSVSMARSLEVRVPFLDTPLVEFICALPDSARVQPGQKKALLLKALEGLLPAEILRQKKRTFTLPWEEWLRIFSQAETRRKLLQPCSSSRSSFACCGGPHGVG